MSDQLSDQLIDTQMKETTDKVRRVGSHEVKRHEVKRHEVGSHKVESHKVKSHKVERTLFR